MTDNKMQGVKSEKFFKFWAVTFVWAVLLIKQVITLYQPFATLLQTSETIIQNEIFLCNDILNTTIFSIQLNYNIKIFCDETETN